MKIIKNLILIIFVLSLVLPLSALAIGQMTEPIVIKDVLRDSQVTETLILYNSENKEIVYGLKAEGEIADWTSFYKIDDTNLENPITEIQIPAKLSLNALVKFDIPKNIPNGDYTGHVVIMTIPMEEKETKEVSALLRLRVSREVSITVTDKEIFNFETTIIPLKYGLSKNEPLEIKIIYYNQGNVSIEPNIQLKITQISTGKVVQNTVIYPYPEDANPVKPFERKVFENLIEWPTAGRENGRYLAELSVLLNGEVIQKEDFSFYVGFDWSKFLASIAIIGGGNLTLAWFIIGVILLVIAGILIFVSKNQNFLKSQILKKWNRKIKKIFFKL